MISFVIVDLIFIIVIFLDLILFLVMHIKGKKNCNYPKTNTLTPKFACLIPAREESKVIENLIASILNNTYKIKNEDIYVIVESVEDPTVKICERNKINCFVRQKLNLKRKGYALDECIKDILSKNKHYDAYFIFDADNVLDKDYFKNMFKTFKDGYDIGVGYRNSKNGNDNVISACSSLTFSMINTIGNDSKNQDTRNITVSGTGFYIKGDYIEKWGGYPFHSLTEDYELTLYSTLNGLTSYYNDKACFYDEQPTTFKVSLTQRTRWVKGFFECRKKYAKKLRKKATKNGKNSGSQFIDGLGIIPFVILVIDFIVDLLYKLLGFLYLVISNNSKSFLILGEIVLLLLVCYVILFLFTGLMIYKENNKLNLTFKSQVKALFFNPLFLASYVHCAIVALTTKNIDWTPIKHVK